VEILELPGISGDCPNGSIACSPEMAAMFQEKASGN
jgi:hypothetical protein